MLKSRCLNGLNNPDESTNIIVRSRIISPLCVSGMALVSALLFTACTGTSQTDSDVFGQEITRLSDKAVAVVDGSTIYDTDIDRVGVEQGIILAGEHLSPDDEAYGRVLDELIDQRLLGLAARRQDLHNSAQGRRRLAVAAERILGNIIVEDHLAQTVNDDEARKLYQAQLALRSTGDEVHARHILVGTKEQAEMAVKRLDDGETFAAVAYDMSIDLGTRADGGDLGYFQADVMVPSFTQIVFALEQNDVSVPFETEYGWHIAELLDRRPAPQLSFEYMREEIDRKSVV